MPERVEQLVKEFLEYHAYDQLASVEQQLKTLIAKVQYQTIAETWLKVSDFMVETNSKNSKYLNS